MKKNFYLISDHKYKGGAGDVLKAFEKVLKLKNHKYSLVYSEQYDYFLEDNGKKNKIGSNYTKLSFLNPILMNISLRKYINVNDIIISNNGICYGLPGNKCDICYVHYSRYLNYKEHAFSNNLIKSLYKILSASFYFFVEKMQKPQYLLFNSKYSFSRQSHMASIFSEILYPPVVVCKQDISKIMANKENMIVSIGRFSLEKNHFLQLKIAEKFKDINFIIIGSVDKDFKYFKKIEKQASCLKNVRIIPNAKWEDVTFYLKKAKFLLHTMVGEHFGISIVQAYGFGCVPIVHKDSGAIEVLEHYFIWNNFEDIVNILNINKNKCFDFFENQNSTSASDLLYNNFMDKISDLIDIVKKDEPFKIPVIQKQ